MRSATIVATVATFPLSIPTPYNATAWAQLTEAASAPTPIEAILLEYESDGADEKPAWGFLVNPAVIEIENSAQYGEVAPHASTVTSSQYSHTSGETLTTPGMMFSLWCYKKSVRSLLSGLKKLLEADPVNDRFAPPLLRFSWGSFNVGPLVLIKYSYKITAVLNGEPTDVRDLTLTFKLQPRPLTQAEQEQLAQARLTQAVEDAAARGAPRLPLTDRALDEARARARAFLERNRDRFSADVQSTIRANRYTLSVSPETGIVTMVDADGSRIGVVSQFDGDRHKVERRSFTIPLASGAPPIADGAITADGTLDTATAAAPLPTM